MSALLRPDPQIQLGSIQNPLLVPPIAKGMGRETFGFASLKILDRPYPPIEIVGRSNARCPRVNRGAPRSGS